MSGALSWNGRVLLDLQLLAGPAGAIVAGGGGGGAETGRPRVRDLRTAAGLSWAWAADIVNDEALLIALDDERRR